MRTLAAVVVSALLLVSAFGCQQTRLVKHPPAPFFGPRVASTSPSATTRPGARPQLPPRETTAQASAWNVAAWRPDVPERAWRFIVIHHSATPTGSADEFDRMHRAKGWDELGYHFVIGNGTGSADGEVEVGSRWPKQKHGAHAKVEGHPEYNDVGVGICLVGNFDVTHPSESQMASLARLIRFLTSRYNIPRNRIYGHGQLKPTDCPGRNFDYIDLFRRLGS